MLQGQQVYLRIPKATESYSSTCRVVTILVAPWGDHIVSMNFLCYYLRLEFSEPT